MSNHTVKAQREQWIARASELIKMDDDTRITNYHEALDQMVAELGISADSARTALGHAARRYRSKLFSSTAAAVSLGSTTSERKAAAARENGKRGGRPRKNRGGNEMITLNIVAQNGHTWTETVDSARAEERAEEIVKEHGDIERVELLTPDGPNNIYTHPAERR